MPLARAVSSTTQLQRVFARRREAEQIRIERSVAVDRYFDKWGRITSRFESWTTPEYYKQSEEKCHQMEENKRKKLTLESRREKLKHLLDQEKENYARELEELKKPKPKKISMEIMAGINENLKMAEEERRKKELEAQLYSRWRYGMTRDKLLLESKNENQAMAKLNWLDRQVEMQLEREKEQKVSQERQLKIQEEKRKHEELLTQSYQLRESEIRELRSMLDSHMAELKTRESDSSQLKYIEFQLHRKKEELDALLKQLMTRQRAEINLNIHNFRKVKMALRQRCEMVRQEVMLDIDLLQKICVGCDDESNEKLLLYKFQKEYNEDLVDQEKINCMYDSEAKHLLIRQEAIWRDKAECRQRLLKNLLFDLSTEIDQEIANGVKREQELTEIRQAHLNAIENINSRLKELTRQNRVTDESDLRVLKDTETRRPATVLCQSATQLEDSSRCENSSSIVDQMSRNIQQFHLNSDDSHKEGNDELHLPRFGRRKIAWC